MSCSLRRVATLHMCMTVFHTAEYTTERWLKTCTSDELKRGFDANVDEKLQIMTTVAMVMWSTTKACFAKQINILVNCTETRIRGLTTAVAIPSAVLPSVAGKQCNLIQICLSGGCVMFIMLKRIAGSACNSTWNKIHRPVCRCI